MLEAVAKAKIQGGHWVKVAAEVYDPDGGWFVTGTRRVNPRSTHLKEQGTTQADHRKTIHWLEDVVIGRRWEEDTRVSFMEALERQGAERGTGDTQDKELVTASTIQGRCRDGTTINVVLQSEPPWLDAQGSLFE